MMYPDPILAEIRQIREQIAEEFQYDVHAIVKDAQRRDALGDRLVVHRERRPAVKPRSVATKTA